MIRNQRQESILFKLLFGLKWHPKATTIGPYIIFTLFGIIFLSGSILLFHHNNKIHEYKILNYHEIQECKSVLHTQNTCNFTIQIQQKLTPPIYLLYELENFYQNHRRYVQSKSNKQLGGISIDHRQARFECNPIILNQNLNINVSWGGKPLDPKQTANPCGLIANSFFNDTYRIINNQRQQIIINQSDISWPNDRTIKYRRAQDSSNIQWIDPQNQHFVVWMRTAGLPTFRKLWGKINVQLTPGNYTLLILNNYNIKSYNGAKNIVLTKIGYLGGKSVISQYIFFLISLMCFITVFIFYLKSRSIQTKAQ